MTLFFYLVEFITDGPILLLDYFKNFMIKIHFSETINNKECEY